MEFTNYIQGNIELAIIEKELDNFFPFYKTLNTELKKRFIYRTSEFIKSKKFVPRQNVFLSQHIVIIISACAIQITFGLDEYLIEHFEYVLVYPDIYESPVTGKRHKGETNLSGFICLSWVHVQTGVDNTNDNYNLGLHEWMHALRFNGFKGASTDYFFENYINKWIACSIPEYYKLKNGKSSIFRKYGAENINEFLSVCTEHFFESPEEFKDQSPELFKQTCILLNVEPSKTESKVGVRDKYLLKKQEENIYEVPILEIEASLKYTFVNFGIRFLYYGAAMFILLPLNNIVANIFAALLTLGAIIFMSSRYSSTQFYKNYIYFQEGFFDSFAKNQSLHYSQIIKIENEDSQYEAFESNLLKITYYDGYIFKTKEVTLNTFDIPREKIKNILQEKNILNKF